MNIQKLALAFIAAFSMSGCLGSGADGLTSRASLPNPGVSFFDASQRMEALRTRSCRPYRPDPLSQFQPLPINGAAGFAAYDKHGRQFAEALNGVAMRYLDTQQPRYAEDAITNLRRFADADAFQLRGEVNASAYAVAQVTQFLLPAWQVLMEYDGLTDEDRAAIEAWLLRLVDRAMREQPDTNNHQTSQGMTLALAGTIFNRPDWFRRSLDIGYRDQIDQLRPDGSWPLEAERGQRAVVYTSRNIAHMLIVAEIARNQGVDLYNYAPQRRSIHDAVRFMLAARSDNSLIDNYAAANMFVPDHYAVFRPNAQEDPFAGHDTSWVPIYAARFPDSDLTRQLRRLKPATPNQGIRFSAVGGNVTCMVGL